MATLVLARKEQGTRLRVGKRVRDTWATYAYLNFSSHLPLMRVLLAKNRRGMVAFRSAERCGFRGAKGCNATVIDSPVPVGFVIARGRGE
jgi:hypothetical protein